MSQPKEHRSTEDHDCIPVRAKGVSRREFLRLAAVAGASVSMAAGLGSFAMACGGEDTTTTTSEAMTTTTGQGTTTVSVAPTLGSEIKVGFVSPLTGNLAFFGVPDKYCLERWNEFIADGLVCGDGLKHPIKIILEDSQSDANRAAQVAGDLINNSGVDMMMVASAGDTVNPVSDQCEAFGVPCFATDNPAEGFFAGREVPADGFKWTYLAFWSNASQADAVIGMWPQIETNKVVGALWPNDIDGAGYREVWPAAFEARGFTHVDAGSFQVMTEDYTSIIQQFKKAGVEILSGTMITPDFANFYKQAKQQGFSPKIAAIGKATTFPEGVTSFGELGTNMATSIIWHPSYPYKSSLTGETCQQLAEDYEKRVGTQFSPAVLHYAAFEWVVDVLKRAKDPADKNQIVEGMKTTKLETMNGTFDFTQPVDAKGNRPWINVCLTPNVAGQWVKGTGKWPFDLVICNSGKWSDIPATGTLLPLP